MKSIIFAICLLLSACRYTAEPSLGPVEEYQPLYYEGSEVWYSDDGRPYIFVGAGDVEWIPAQYPQYDLYVMNYRHHYPIIHRQYEDHGLKAQYNQRYHIRHRRR